MVGENRLSLVSEPGEGSSEGHNEEGNEVVGVVGSLGLTHDGENLRPGEAVGEDACVFSRNTTYGGGLNTVARGINLSAISAALSRVGITIEIKILDLGDKVVDVVKVEASSSEAAHYFLFNYNNLLL